jgi:Putative glycolipid-binding
MPFPPPPPAACWQHREARSGFEVAYFRPLEGGWAVDGTTGAGAAAPAAYVRAPGLSVERLEQTYLRIAGEAAHHLYDYAAPPFGFTSRLAYDESGLVLDYPGIARRAG